MQLGVAMGGIAAIADLVLSPRGKQALLRAGAVERLALALSLSKEGMPAGCIDVMTIICQVLERLTQTDGKPMPALETQIK